MKGNYYFFELEDYSLPGIASGTLKYLGTKTDLKKTVARNQSRNEGTS